MKSFAIAAALLSASLTLAQATPKLHVGSPAPALKVFKLVKGTDFPGVKPGKVYVVEFWATWCGPCRESIPHLTKLAKKFKNKATFLGVDSFEEQQRPGNTSTGYVKAIRSFVKEMGKKMDYFVVADDPVGHLGKSWMDAAGQDGIPTAFVVDKHHKIAWIGHPMFGLDEALDAVLKGKKPPTEAENASSTPDAASQGDAPPQFKALNDAMQSQDPTRIVEECDKLLKANPENETMLAEIKFNALGMVSHEKAVAYAKEAADRGLKDNPSSLNNIAWAQVDPEHPYAGADAVFAENISRRAIGLLDRSNPLHALTMDTLAAAIFLQGKKDDAIAEEKLAIAEAKSLGTKITKAQLDDLNRHMKLFQGGKSV